MLGDLLGIVGSLYDVCQQLHRRGTAFLVLDRHGLVQLAVRKTVSIELSLCTYADTSQTAAVNICWNTGGW